MAETETSLPTGNW